MLRIAFLVAALSLSLIPRTAYSQSAAPSHPAVLDVTSMDTSIDPCTDFFTYSCGGWLQKNPIPPDRTSWGITTKLADDNRVQLREILEQAAAGGPGQDSVKRKIGDYYAACMDEKAIEAAGAAPLNGNVQRIAAMHIETGHCESDCRYAGPECSVRVRIRSGLQKFFAGHRRSRPGRPGTSRPRLLPQDRRQICRASAILRGAWFRKCLNCWATPRSRLHAKLRP